MMGIKLHTPKSLKAGSRMASLKQFLLSLFATTFSIALTFGTAAIIDHYKKQGEKREIVMMVMYDMYNSLKSVEVADSLIRESMKLQQKIAEDTSVCNFDTKYQMVLMMPRLEYTETTEHIFSSSIETINTVGNVLFTENVAEFYQTRQQYKTVVCDSVSHQVIDGYQFSSLKGILSFDYLDYALYSTGFKDKMQSLFAQCQQMMKVSDEELDAYRKQREQIRKDHEQNDNSLSTIKELQEIQKSIDDATDKLNLK